MLDTRTASPDPITDDPAEQPLRVAVFANEFPALSETFVLSHITGLLDFGNDVTVFANTPRAGDPAAHSDFYRYRLDQRLHYRPMPRARVRRMLGVPEILFRRGFAPAVVQALDPVRYRREAVSLSLLHWADRLLDFPPFDIIHCHFGQTGRVVAFLREIGAIRGPLVVNFHGVDASACLDQDPGLYRHLFRTGEMFLPVSEHFRQRLIRHGCNPTRIKVHHLGVDPGRFPYRPRHRDAARPFAVLTVARLVEKKGVADGLHAMAQVAASGAPIHYVIVGDGPLRGELEALAGELGIAAAVTFAGWKTQDEIIALMQDVDALLFPSVTGANGDQEGSPVVLKEAMATGLAVVATRHAGVAEIVEHGACGFLAAEHDVEGLAAGLSALVRDPQLCARFGAEAHAKVIAEFDVNRLNRRLQQHYRSLL